MAENYLPDYEYEEVHEEDKNNQQAGAQKAGGK